MEAVGIGCFWFARRTDVAEPKQNSGGKEHLERVRTALEEIENISDVDISIYGQGQIFISGFSLGDEENNYDNIYSNVEITFKIFMPFKLQQKYSCFNENIEAETFDVSVVYSDHMPVVYVSYFVDEGPEDVYKFSPSSAVEFIRKYLEERLRANPHVDFQVLGPSALTLT